MSEEAQKEEQTFTFRVAMDIRAYGVVVIKSDSIEAAKKQLTAENVADKFEPHGSSDDYDFNHPSEIWVESAENEDTGEETMIDYTVPNGPWITT